jgi:protein TonB
MRVRTPESTRSLSTTIFVGSLLAHAILAAGLHIAAAADRSARALTPEIDIELAPPPPPPPPPKVEEPPPPPPKAAEPPKPRAPKPEAPKPQVVRDTPPPATSDLPSSPDGELTAGPATPAPTIAAPPPPPPPPAPPAPKPAPVVEAKEGANYLKNPRPRYPHLALREGWEGRVILRVKVLPNGKVGGATVQKSAGRNVLDEAALEIVQTWTFVPATQGGKPVAGFVAVPFDFRIN